MLCGDSTTDGNADLCLDFILLCSLDFPNDWNSSEIFIIYGMAFLKVRLITDIHMGNFHHIPRRILVSCGLVVHVISVFAMVVANIIEKQLWPLRIICIGRTESCKWVF